MSAPDRLTAALADRYRLERELGQGGMATVYLAHDLRHDRQVALKVLRPELAATLGPERFVNEIHTAARLTHPHILPVHDSGEAAGFLFYVMPFIDGETLRERLTRQGILPVAEAARLLRDVADALAAAHALGVVHRDIKPDNILLTGRHALVADFGVSKAVSEATGRQHVTTVGTALGTPQYMAPEQAAADVNIDHRADIYALGILAYELLTGHPPFGGSPQQILAAQVMTAPVPVTQVRPDLPPALGELVMRCLAKSPAERWQSAGDVARTLETFATPSGGITPTQTRPVPAVKPRAVRRWVLAGLAAAVLAIAGIGAWRLRAPAPAALDENLIAIFPFRVTSVDSSLRYLGEGMVDLLAGMYTGEGGPRAVDVRTALAAWKRHAGIDQGETAAPVAARDLGAGQYLLGSVVSTGARLVLSASVGRTGASRADVLARVEGPADSLSGLLNALVGQLLVRGAGLTEERAVGLPSSLEATRAFVAGRAANRRGDWEAAALQFDRAIALDSSFTLAALGMSEASAWLTVSLPGLPRVQELAWAKRTALSPRDQALLAGYTAGTGPAPDSRADELRSWEAAVSRFPDLADAWYWLGETHFHHGRTLGFEDHFARARQAMEMASSLDPDMMAPLYHRIEMAGMRRDTAAAERLFAQYLAHDSVSETRSILELYVAEGVRDSAAMAAAVRRFARTGHVTVGRAPQYLVRIGRSLEWVDTLLTLARRTAGSATIRETVERVRLSILLDFGRPAEAIGGARQSGAWDDATAMGAVLFAGAPREAALEAWQRQSRLAQAPPAPSVAARRAQYVGACLVGQWNLVFEPGLSVEGVSSALRRGAAVRDESGRPEANPACLAIVEAMAAVRDGRPDRVALVLRLDSLLLTVPPGMSSVNNQRFEDGLQGANLVTARMLERLGLTAQAFRTAGRGIEWSGSPYQPVSPYFRELGRLAALAGEPEAAADAYRQYLTLRFDPEPAMIPQRDSVRAELAAITGGPDESPLTDGGRPSR
ncbi:MAG TPA: serine/threonine-protein kinase [Gemmatimonadales bacterium]|nr:serine/threonine-protein kinase [Gemmatimonadales bacterium]